MQQHSYFVPRTCLSKYQISKTDSLIFTFLFFFLLQFWTYKIFSIVKGESQLKMLEMRGEAGKTSPKKVMDNLSFWWRHMSFLSDFLDLLSIHVFLFSLVIYNRILQIYLDAYLFRFSINCYIQFKMHYSICIYL